jgi:hypothetical protein
MSDIKCYACSSKKYLGTYTIDSDTDNEKAILRICMPCLVRCIKFTVAQIREAEGLWPIIEDQDGNKE